MTTSAISALSSTGDDHPPTLFLSEALRCGRCPRPRRRDEDHDRRRPPDPRCLRRARLRRRVSRRDPSRRPLPPSGRWVRHRRRSALGPVPRPLHGRPPGRAALVGRGGARSASLPFCAVRQSRANPDEFTDRRSLMQHHDDVSPEQTRRIPYRAVGRAGAACRRFRLLLLRQALRSPEHHRELRGPRSGPVAALRRRRSRVGRSDRPAGARTRRARGPRPRRSDGRCRRRPRCSSWPTATRSSRSFCWRSALPSRGRTVAGSWRSFHARPPGSFPPSPGDGPRREVDHGLSGARSPGCGGRCGFSRPDDSRRVAR